MNTNKHCLSKSIKVVIFILFGCLIVNTAVAQQKVERFCRLDVWYKSEHKQVISINYGNKKDFLALTDTTALNNLDKVNSFNNDIDAINYMSKLGWSFVKTVSLSTGFSPEYECFFKKTYETTR